MFHIIGDIASIISIIAAGFTVTTYVMLFRHKRRIRLLSKFAHYKKDGFLIVVPLNKKPSTERQVMTVIQNDLNAHTNKFAGIASSAHSFTEFIRTVTISDHVQEKDIDQYAKEFLKQYHELKSMGCDRVHLFLQVPIGLGVVFGSLLSNKGLVHFWHYQSSTSTYQDWGQVDRSRRLFE